VLLLSGKANATPDGCTSSALSNERSRGPPWALPNVALHLQVSGISIAAAAAPAQLLQGCVQLVRMLKQPPWAARLRQSSAVSSPQNCTTARQGMETQGPLELALDVPMAALQQHVSSATEARAHPPAKPALQAAAAQAGAHWHAVLTGMCDLLTQQAQALLRLGALGRELDMLCAAVHRHRAESRVALQAR